MLKFLKQHIFHDTIVSYTFMRKSNHCSAVILIFFSSQNYYSIIHEKNELKTFAECWSA